MKKRLLVVVPMKDPKLSKSRLQDVLADHERTRFAKLLLNRTLALLSALKSDREFDIGVVSSSQEVARVAERHETHFISEETSSDLNGAVSHAAKWAYDQGFGRLCVLPADLAAPDPTELQMLFEHGTEHIAICPSVDLGTNALILPLPNRIEFSFGPQSAAAHCNAAERAGYGAKILPLESLRYDIDTSADLGIAQGLAPDLTGFGAL